MDPATVVFPVAASAAGSSGHQPTPSTATSGQAKASELRTT
jgi:hypothetical protein